MNRRATPPTETWQDRCMEKYYHGRPGWVDGTTQFQQLVGEFAVANATILELGCGQTNHNSRFFASLGTLVGLDVNPAAQGNEYCEQVLLYDGGDIPCDADSFDLVASNYVVEHVEHPEALCREIHRVLRPGGAYVFRTPNLWHYVSLVSRLTPHWFHELVSARLRHSQPSESAVFPTFHRLNTRKACRKVLGRASFEIEALKLIESQPSYGMASRCLFYPLMLWERLLNSSAAFENLRANIICAATAVKSAGSSGADEGQ